MATASKKKYLRSEKGKIMERRRTLKKTYGITLELFNQMYKAQGGICAICHKSETAKNQYGVKQLSVDHDHKTNKIRGLLCHHCNMALGYMRDDPNLLVQAAGYLGRQAWTDGKQYPNTRTESEK